MVKFFVLCLTLFFSIVSSKNFNDCEPKAENPIDWIIQQRQLNFGWKEHTHRANIALAIAGWKGTDAEMSKMALELELEITTMLMRNKTAAIHENDLALFIHALLARNKNPRNFHGFDLVGDLLHRINYAGNRIHPFLVLTLCNSGAVEMRHLNNLKKLLEHEKDTSHHMEMKALALKAFACAANNTEDFSHDIILATESLISKQNGTDGSFGNVYTTALVVQALIASGAKAWNRTKALKFLENGSLVQMNMIKTCLIVMAQQAEKVKFIKNLYYGKPEGPEEKHRVREKFIHYAIVANPNLFHTISINVPLEWNFFDVMKRSSQLSDKFNFTYHPNEQKNPVIYSVAGIPNDAEENKFWMLCLQRRRERNSVQTVVYFDSPVKLTPQTDDRISYYYGQDGSCPSTFAQ